VLLIALLVLFKYFYLYAKEIPFLNFHHEKLKKSSKIFQIKDSLTVVNKHPFTKLLAVAVIFQFVLFTFVEFQFAKGVELDLEQQGSHQEDLTFKPEHLAVSLMHADTLNVQENVGQELESNLHERATAETATSTPTEQDVAHVFGLIMMIASISTFLLEMFFSSKVLKKLGVIKSMMVHPIVLMINGMILGLRFGFVSASNLKIWFEGTNSIYLNAYNASYYNLHEEDRATVKEFFDGIMKPFGIIMATLTIWAVYKFFPSGIAVLYINMALILSAFILFLLLIKVKEKYTDLSLHHLKLSDNDLATKLNAVEILSQHGHRNIVADLAQELFKDNLHERLKVKLLAAMGYIGYPVCLQYILKFLDDNSYQVRLASIYALKNFIKRTKKIFSKPFTIHQITTRLKIMFKIESDSVIKMLITKALFQLKEPKVTELILEALNEAHDLDITASTINICKIFKDEVLAHHLEIFLKHKDIRIRTNAITALWNLPEYRENLAVELINMFNAKDRNTLISAFFIAGETKAQETKDFLKNYLKSNDLELRVNSALALAKMEDPDCLKEIVKLLTHEKPEIAKQMKQALLAVKPKFKWLIEKNLSSELYRKINKILENYKNKNISNIPCNVLLRLKVYYEIADHFEEALRIERFLNSKQNPLAIT